MKCGHPSISADYYGSPPGRWRRTLYCLLAAHLCLIFAVTAAAVDPGLSRHKSQHYLVWSNLTLKQTRLFARHMDTIFAEYQKRFRQGAGLRAKLDFPMSLYLFQTREQYTEFLTKNGIAAANSGGIFFYKPRQKLIGLATFVRGRSIREVISSLQHEGFHQFALKYIGPKLPVWLGEGMAQYFEDGIYARGEFVLHIANASRIEAVKAAIEQRRYIPFDRMLKVTGKQWRQNMRQDPKTATLFYQQSWSMVFFLIGDRATPRRRAFIEYLQRIADGADSEDAFRKAYRTASHTAFEKAWLDYAATAQPDDLHTAIARMNFLGRAMRFLREKDQQIPRSIRTLRKKLQSMRFTVTYRSHGFQKRLSALDDSLYRYPLHGRLHQPMFRMLEPEANDLLPRIWAPGLDPEPTLVWYRDAEGTLVQDVVFN